MAGMNGVPVGLNHSAVFEHARIRGYDVPVLTHLIKPMETGMMEAMQERIKDAQAK